MLLRSSYYHPYRLHRQRLSAPTPNIAAAQQQRHVVSGVVAGGSSSEEQHRSRAAEFEGFADDYLARYSMPRGSFENSGRSFENSRPSYSQPRESLSQPRQSYSRPKKVQPQNQHGEYQDQADGEQLDGGELRRVESNESVAAGGEETGFLDVDLEEEGGKKREKGLLVGEGGEDDIMGRGEWFRSGGWRAGVAANVAGLFVVLVVGFVCLIIAISGVSVDEGRSAVYAGGCATAAAVKWALHAVISVFAVGTLAGANYVVQVLGSPTRGEVTAAHKRGEWLDIGVGSVRNLGRVERSRAFLGGVIVAAAILTQIM